jgi:hypothetical protein
LHGVECVQERAILEGFVTTCYRCGGETLSAGALFSGMRTSFRPQETKFLTLMTGDVMTKAMMCRDCGVIEIIGDVSKLRHLTSEPEPTTEKFTVVDSE